MKNQSIPQFFATGLITLLLILFTATLSYAEKRYIVDVLIVTLREGPSPSFRTIQSLKTGQSFTVLAEQGDFIKVETEDKTVGWLLSQYTSKTPPAVLQIEEITKKLETLSKENDKLKQTTIELKVKLKDKEKDLSEITEQYTLIKKSENSDLTHLQQLLDSMTEQYNALLEESKSTIQTVNERDLLLKQQSILQKKVSTLEDENTNLANKQGLYWFLAGAGILVLGWLVGRVSSKRPKSSLTL